MCSIGDYFNDLKLNGYLQENLQQLLIIIRNIQFYSPEVTDQSWLGSIREWTGIASAAELFRRAIINEDYKKPISNSHL